MKCPRCQHETPSGAEFCPECGTKLAAVCVQCGAENAPTHKFCTKCGSPLALAPWRAPDIQTVRSSSEAERRQLTIMFCDLVGSTALSERLDPEDLRDVLRAYQDACADAMRRFEGHIAQTLGDGLMVYFGYPRAHEDDVHRAVRAGLEILHGIAGLDRRLRADRGVEVAVRIGIHTGLVVAGEVGGADTRADMAVIGETPNFAARVQALAAPNTVVVSEATWRLLGGAFEAEDLGGHSLKGLSAPQRLFRILKEHPAEGRFEAMHRSRLTPLVGRDEEIGLLLSRWALAKNGGGQVVVLCGEPGIGKSRITRTTRERIAGERYVSLQYQCSPFFTNTAFYPVMQQLQFAAGFTPEDSADAKLDRLERLLTRSGGAVQNAVPLLAALLSLPTGRRYPPLALSPQRQKERTIEVLVEQLRHLATVESVLAIFEDVHWIDPTTLEYLDYLVSELANIAVLVVITHRPEFEPPWGRHANVTLHSLNRLSRRQCAMMVGRVGGKPLPEALVGQIVDKSDGVPLFVEELTKAVVESPLVVDAGTSYELSGTVDSLRIPATLHDSLMARLDRLIPVKEVAQIGAAIGREFSHELLAAVSPMGEADLNVALDRFLRSDLVYQRGVRPRATYIFKHAMIQETAYQSLLRATRQQYHRRIAAVLLEQFPETVDTQPEIIAHHLTEARLDAPASEYWHRAGRRAVERSAHAEAIELLTRGLDVLAGLPDTPDRALRELELRITLGPSLTATKGYAAPEVQRLYERARELCQRVGGTERLFSVLFGLWVYYLVRAELNEAREMGEQLVNLAGRLDHRTSLIDAQRALGITLFFRGELTEALAHFQAAIALYDVARDSSVAFASGVDTGPVSMVSAAMVQWLVGHPAQALATTGQALNSARKRPHPFTLAVVLTYAAWVHQFRREAPAAREQAEAGIAVTTEGGFPVWLGEVLIIRGWALAELGEDGEGVEQVRRGLTTFRATGAVLVLPYWLGLLADVHGKADRTADALQCLDEAIALSDRTGDRFYLAELHRLRGELLLRRADGAEHEPESCFRLALAIAASQNAKSLELRAAMSLARLLESEGKREEARRMLAEIYDWFTEGFDTADLRDAKTLLDKLTAT